MADIKTVDMKGKNNKIDEIATSGYVEVVEENTNSTEPKIEPKIKEETKSTESKSTVKRIDLYKLVENYKKRSSTKLKEEFLKAQVKIVPYQGYTTKLFLAQNIINISCMKDGKVHIDSCKKYIMYIYTMLKFYTNIDIQEKDLMAQYDLLDENDLVEKILALIPEKEIVTFKTILDMKLDDLMTNKYGTHAFVEEQMDRIENISSKFSEAFAPVIETLTEKVKTLDENKIEKMLKGAMKYVSK